MNEEYLKAYSKEYSNLLKRAYLFLEDEDFQKADEYAERVLDCDSECAEAYLIKLCCELRLTSREALFRQTSSLDQNKNFQKAMRFGGEELKKELNEYKAAAPGNKRAYDEDVAKKRYIAGMITAGDDCTAAVGIDGKGRGVGYNLWHELNFRQDDIISVAYCGGRIICLRGNGEVFSTGSALAGISPVTYDSNYCCKKLFSGQHCTFVIDGWDGMWIQGDHAAILDMQDIIDGRTDLVGGAAGLNHIVCLSSSGNVLGVGSNAKKQLEVSWWNDIDAIAAGAAFTVGLKRDGTVIGTGDEAAGLYKTKGWQDIIAIAAGGFHTLGLKNDGTVVATGSNNFGQCNVSSWRNIVAVACGWLHSVGVCADGTVVATGMNNNGQCDVSGWKLFNSYTTIFEERKEMLKKAESQLKVDFANAKGLFARSKKKEIQERLDELQKELSAL